MGGLWLSSLWAGWKKWEDFKDLAWSFVFRVITLVSSLSLPVATLGRGGWWKSFGGLPKPQLGCCHCRTVSFTSFLQVRNRRPRGLNQWPKITQWPSDKAWEPSPSDSNDLAPLLPPSMVEKTQLWGDVTLNVSAVCIMEGSFCLGRFERLWRKVICFCSCNAISLLNVRWE